MALALSGLSLLVSALTLLPGRPVPFHGGLVTIEFALLFPLFIVTVARGIALRADGTKVTRADHWPAVRRLPRSVRFLLFFLFASGIGLTAGGMVADTSRQAGRTEAGRYYAIDLGSATHEQVEVSKSEYDALRRHDQRAVHAIGGLLAAGAATLTLIIGQAQPGTERHLPPHGLDSAA
ncbi:hypothetical protein [Streptomyces sp. NPDC102462]|uniref:hypothetical protein n=1 Tax=Streptomyces sp. NPDC102462 TaxID=3366178 RepID=UPI0038115C01